MLFIQTNWATEIFDYKNGVECSFCSVLSSSTFLLLSVVFLLTSPAHLLLCFFFDTDALDDIPSAVRTYPASGATAMLPLTPANNYTATIVFCGGTDLLADQWVTNWNIAGYAADKTCVKVSSSCETTADEGSTDSDSFYFLSLSDES